MALLAACRHLADVPVLLLRRHPGRPLRPAPLHHRLPVLDDGRGRDPGGAGLLRPAQPLEPSGAHLLHRAGQRHERAGLARHRARDRLGPAAAAGDRAQQRGLQPRPHRGPGGRPDPARPRRRLPSFRHQRRHLHRRHLRHVELEAAAPRPGPASAARASSRPPARASPSCATRASSRPFSPAASASSRRASPSARCCR